MAYLEFFEFHHVVEFFMVLVRIYSNKENGSKQNIYVSDRQQFHRSSYLLLGRATNSLTIEVTARKYVFHRSEVTIRFKKRRGGDKRTIARPQYGQRLVGIVVYLCNPSYKP